MQCLSALVLLVTTIIVVNSQRCCTPDQWEGRQDSQTGFVYRRRPGLVYGGEEISYDFTNTRLASFATYYYNEKVRKYQIVVRYDNSNSTNDGLMYIVDKQNGKCYKKELDGPFRQACIPEKAKSLGESVYGLGENSVRVNNYYLEWKKDATEGALKYDRRRGKYQANIFSSVTADSCVPVTESITGTAHGVPFMEGIGFVNVTGGIQDESVFDVPEACDDMKNFPEYMLTILDRRHSMMAF